MRKQFTAQKAIKNLIYFKHQFGSKDVQVKYLDSDHLKMVWFQYRVIYSILLLRFKNDS